MGKSVTAPGHKLGQMIGNFFEAIISANLERVAKKHGLYLDRKGLRPGVRGTKRKLTWADSEGNRHDLDYVFERGGTADKLGRPVAFVEMAWRRYTKHSRNKTGEIEGALLHLRDSHRSCLFSGVVLAGEYTGGGIQQLRSHGIAVLHLPYSAMIAAFQTKGIDLDYPENASASRKRGLVSAWARLTKTELAEIAVHFEEAVRPQVEEFILKLEAGIARRIESISVVGLYGRTSMVKTIAEALQAVRVFREDDLSGVRFAKFEVVVRMGDGSEIVGRAFPTKEAVIQFLEQFGTD
jgi:hypothetical protein